MVGISRKPKVLSDRALEMILRDVLSGIYDLSLRSSASAESMGFEILSIEPVSTPTGCSAAENVPAGDDGDKPEATVVPLLRTQLNND